MTMSDLTLKVAVLIGDNIPSDWIAHAIQRTTRYTTTEKEQAMTYLNKFTPRSADIGEEEEIEIVEMPEPAETPAPVEVPAEPVPA